MKYECETDLDLPPVRRTEANYWKAKCLEYMIETIKANRGIRRLQTRLVNKEELKKQSDILNLKGLGKEIWKGQSANDFVKSLREEWDDPENDVWDNK